MSTHACCGGLGEHFEWCRPQRPILCRCGNTPVFTVCEDCELSWLEERLAAQHKLPADHPAQEAYNALLRQHQGAA